MTDPICGMIESSRLRRPPLTETERADALTARSLHDREYSWRQIGHAMRRDPEQVRRLVQRLNHEEGETA